MHSSGREAKALLVVLLAGQSLANIDTAIVNVATPSIHAELGATGAELQLVVFGYILAYAMLLITAARLGDLRGYRRIFLLGLAVFTAASLACGLAPNPATLILARIVEGAGAALLTPQVLTGIQLRFSGEARARALGLFVMALSGSAVIGQILGGALISANLFGTGWRPIFLINLPIGIGLIVTALRFLPKDQGGRPARLDLSGVGLLSAGMLLALAPVALGREAGWPAWTWICLAASLPVFWLFVNVERRMTAERGSPLLNLRVLAEPAISWALASRAAASGTYFSLLFVLALYLQQGLGESPLYSGLALVSWVAAFGIGGPLPRRLPAALASNAATIGALTMAGAYLGIAASVAAGQPAGALLIALLGFGGFGFGLTTSALLAYITGAVAPDHAPDISGLYNTNSQVAAVVGVATFGTLYLGLVTQAGRPAAMHALAIVAMAFAASALFAAAAAHVATHRPSPARQRSVESAARAA